MTTPHEPEIIDADEAVAIIDKEQAPPADPDNTAMAKVRAAMPLMLADGMSLPSVEEQEVRLKAYDERRDYFRAYIMGKFIEGVHYGFPPGTGCRFKPDGSGELEQLSKGKWLPINKREYTPKPGMYQEGALLLKDLLQFKPEFENDMELWKMMGCVDGMACRKCKLYFDGRLVCDAPGVYNKTGSRMDHNGAVQMADKRALVSAIRRAVPILGELFTEERGQGAGPGDSEAKTQFHSLAEAWIQNKLKADDDLSLEDCKQLISHIRVGMGSDFPREASAAFDWCEQNVIPAVVENGKGQPVGYSFSIRSDGDDSLPT